MKKITSTIMFICALLLSIYSYSRNDENHCESAIPVEVGEAIFNFEEAYEINDGFQIYYSYTADKDIRIEIDLCDSTYSAWREVFETYLGCDENYYYEITIDDCEFGEKKIYTLNKGETLYFNVVTQGDVDGISEFTFYINEIEPQPGELCTLPIELTKEDEGDLYRNFSIEPNQFISRWYTYTANKDEVIELSACGNDLDWGYINFNMYSECYNTSQPYQPHGDNFDSYLDYKVQDCEDNPALQRLIYTIQKNETVYFSVEGYVYEPTNWEFTTRDFYDGEVCHKPIPVVADTTYRTPENMDEIYYSYTPIRAGVVTVSQATPTYVVSAGVMATSEQCDKSAEIFGYATGGKDLLFPVQANQEYIIVWSIDDEPSSNSEQIEWTIELDPTGEMPDGYSCKQPIQLKTSETEIESTSNIVWFEFTPGEGMVALQADLQNDVSVLLFDECSVPVSEDMKGTVDFIYTNNALVFWSEENTTYKMLLVFNEEAPQAHYTVSYSLQAGMQKPEHIVCSDAEVIEKTGEITTNIEFEYWYQYTPTEDVYLEVVDLQERFDDLGVDVTLFTACSQGLDGNDYSELAAEYMYDYCPEMRKNTIWQLNAEETVYIQCKANNAYSALVKWELRESPIHKVAIKTISTDYDFAKAEIDEDKKEVNLHLTHSAPFPRFSLPIYFELEVGNTMRDESLYQICSGSILFDTANSKEVTLQSLYNFTSETWTINVERQEFASNAAGLMGFRSEAIDSYTINTEDSTATLTLAWNAEEYLEDLQIIVSAGAWVSDGEFFFDEEDGEFTITIVAEDSVSHAEWTVYYTKTPVPEGSTYDNPLIAERGQNSVAFANNETEKYYTYTAQTTSFITVSTCMYAQIYPLIEIYDENDGFILISEPEDCDFGNGQKITAYVEKGQEIEIVINREEGDAEYAEYVNFILEEEKIPLIADFNVELLYIEGDEPVEGDEVYELYVGDDVRVKIEVEFESEPEFEIPDNALAPNVEMMSLQGNTLEDLDYNYFKVMYPGVSDIIYTSTDGTKITKKVTITSKLKHVNLTGINILDETLSLRVGESYGFIPEFIPENATDKNLIWVSQDPTIVKVDEFGVVTALAAGPATVEVLHNDESMSQCTIYVSPVSAERIVLNRDTITLEEGTVSSAVYATVLPVNAVNKEVYWESSDENVVQVTESGLLQAISFGTAEVRVALASDTSDTAINAVLHVTVTERTPDNTELQAKVKYVDQLLDIIRDREDLIGNDVGQYPEWVVDSLEQYLSEVEDILYNTNATQLQIEQALQDLIDAVLLFERRRVDLVHIESVHITKDTLTLVKNETKQMFASLYPTHATYTELQWQVQNTEIATINQSGVVTAHKTGSTYIYAFSQDGSNLSDSCLLIVKTPLVSLSLPQTITVLEQESAPLSLRINPLDADVKGYVWSSDDENIAIVNSQGLVTGIREGLATITVQEIATGLSASAVAIVRPQIVSVVSVEIEQDSIVLKVGETSTVYPKVLPIDATNKNYTWSSSERNIAYVNNKGVVTAFDLGVSYISVETEDGGFTAQVKVIVVPSDAPVVLDIPEISVEIGTEEITLSLADIIFDDNTDVADLNVGIVSSSNNVEVIVENGIIQIIPRNPNNPISEIIEIAITDADGQTVVLEIPIEILPTPNADPVCNQDEIIVTIVDGSTFPEIDLSIYFSDDYTKSTDLLYEILGASNYFRTLLSGSVLTVSRYDATWIGRDTITIAVTDAGGHSTSQYVVFEVSQADNTPPTLSPIAEQLYNTTTKKYPTLDLKQFVADDYTLPHNIAWSHLANPRVNISIRKGVVTALPVDPNWTGSTTVTFIATDEEGESAHISVVYSKATQTGTTWIALPKISFTANQTIIAPGETVGFTSSISGATSWIWHFEKGTPSQSNSPNPFVAYSEPGKYKVKLTAANEHGMDSLVKEEYISVIGINPTDEIACVGSPVTLEATVSAANGYTFVWSTGATTETIVVEPKETTTYSLMIRKGLFEYHDNITLTVPDTLVMPADRALCFGNTHTLTIAGFDEYNWNSEGWTTQDSYTVSKVGVTNLSVRDQYGCVSSDDFAITAINPLPIVNLGPNQEICLGTSTVLDAEGTDLQYEWSTSETTPTISVNEDGTYSVTVTDVNECSETATVDVAVLRPYAEQIGVVTFAQEDNSVVVAWERTDKQRTMKYEVLRETSVANEFVKIGELPFDAESLFEDTDADARMKSFRYKIATIDSVCENRVESEPHRSLHIQNSLNTNFKANLSWRAYEGVDFSTYKIYRGTSNTNMVEVDAITSDATSWTDSDVYQFGWVYRIAMVLPEIVETRHPMLKAESGPYSLAMSNIAEAETAIETDLLHQIAVFPTVAESFVMVQVADAITSYQIQIVSTQGAVVYATPILSVKDVEIDVSEFARGAYTLSVIANGAKANIPIIIK
ncbi:MAG: Ig-like domain-containing protein [Bacteroidales bacterium]|nr:Ig-like domain-containing protein [Bacteroidales bacterium]